MTTTTDPRTAQPVRLDSSRTTALVAGAFYLLTEVTAIGGAILYGPLLAGAEYLVAPGGATHALLGALFELMLIVTAVGTAVTLYPIVKRQNGTLAIAFVAARVLESAAILIGILSALSIVTLKQNLRAGIDSSVLLTVGDALLAVHDWSFLLGPGFALGAASLLLASLMFTSRLVPRPIAVLGLVGGSLISLSSVAVLFGAYGQMSLVGFAVALPVFAWEVSLAVWLVAKGFRRSALAALDAPLVDDSTAAKAGR
jgi:hypothetical protein